MAAPRIADNAPARVELESGERYAFCVCGRSANQPFCDGSHKGTGLSPHLFTAEASGTFALCCCKQTSNAPFCDGSHKAVPDAAIGQEQP